MQDNVEDHAGLWFSLSGDSAIARDIILDAQIPCFTCAGVDEVCLLVKAGVGVLVVSSEVLNGSTMETITRALEAQPPWSDIPLLVLVQGGTGTEAVLGALGKHANVTVLDSPVRRAVLVSSIQSALRSRYRQYAARDLLLKLEEADRQKDLFLATLSHELRTPLTAIVGWATLLQGKNISEETLRKALQVILRNANTQSKLIEDILSVSRIILGKVRVDPVPLDLAEVIEAAVETLKPTALAKGISLETQTSAEIRLVRVDRERMHQVVWNLISNSIKFTPVGGTIRLALTYDRDAARLTISDNGIGIDPGFLPHVFEYFRQEDNHFQRNYGGLGLGLAIVRHLVELHGGIVRADSAGLGKGASFTIVLPVAAETAEVPKPEEAAVDVQSQHLRDLRILVVEDHGDTMEWIGKTLQQCGAEVIPAASFEEALRSYRFSRPDLLISDIGLPDKDGDELLRTILADGQLQSVPAIALTACASDEDRARTQAAGFALHLSKPTTRQTLIQSVLEVLHSKSVSPHANREGLG